MYRLLAYFNRRKSIDQIVKLTVELKTLNENKNMNSEQRLKQILANVENAQGIISAPREYMKVN